MDELVESKNKLNRRPLGPSGFSLVDVLRDPKGRDFETEFLDANGHLYVYRYVSERCTFVKATMPSGAAAPVFRTLPAGSTVPVDGWVPMGKGRKKELHLVG